MILFLHYTTLKRHDLSWHFRRHCAIITSQKKNEWINPFKKFRTLNAAHININLPYMEILKMLRTYEVINLFSFIKKRLINSRFFFKLIVYICINPYSKLLSRNHRSNFIIYGTDWFVFSLHSENCLINNFNIL